MWPFRAAAQSMPMAASRTPVGNTVDVANATWTNTIGAGEMITVWRDPTSILLCARSITCE